METLKFKTNINCGGCLSNVTPSLNALKEVKNWNVDTSNPDKVLSVEGDNNLTSDLIIQTLKKAGYRARQL